MKRMNGFSLTWVLVTVTITSIISGLTTGVILYNNNKITNKVSYSELSKDEALNQFLEVYANISSEYYEDVNKQEMLDRAIAAMMDYLGDDYTNYLNNDTTAELMKELAGKYEGIGVSINNSTKEISEVFEDTPASKAGILPKDIIIEVDGKDVKEMSASEIVAIIKEKKSSFSMKLQRQDKIITVTLKNEEIISPSISYHMIEDSSIGYLSIRSFSATLEAQVKKSLERLESQGMNSLIIDVRDNTGGYLDAAVNVINMFLEKGKRIYSLNYKGKIENFNDTTNEKRTYPIVILINNDTASASEILTAALVQSYGATTVGEKSYGKGKVQQTMKLDDGGMVKYTSAYWLTPNGTCIDQIGITPNYEIKNIENENGEIINDLQLEKAIELLKG